MDKKQVMDRILKCWEQFPDMRLGQFLLTVCPEECDYGPELYFDKDDILVASCEGYTEGYVKGSKWFSEREDLVQRSEDWLDYYTKMRDDDIPWNQGD